MKILLGPPLAVNILVKTFFVILYHSGQIELMLGSSLSRFLSVYAGNFLVLSPSCLSLLPLDINSLFLMETAKVPCSATLVFFPAGQSYSTWGQYL